MALKRIEINYGSYTLIKFVEVGDDEIKSPTEPNKEVEKPENKKVGDKKKQKG